jgi:hypothetical protein
MKFATAMNNGKEAMMSVFVLVQVGLGFHLFLLVTFFISSIDSNDLSRIAHHTEQMFQTASTVLKASMSLSHKVDST